jgi:hypothetical protein
VGIHTARCPRDIRLYRELLMEGGARFHRDTSHDRLDPLVT